MIAVGKGLASLFRDGGDYYTMLPDPLFDQLGPRYRTAAIEVWRVLMKYLREWGELDERLITDMIARELKRGHSFVKNGLYGLHRILGVIDRIRKHGRRVITFVRGLAPPRNQRKAESPSGLPLEENPEERRDKETTTTDAGSSSSADSPRTDGGQGEAASPELIARACELIAKATPGRVIDAVRVYGAEWVSLALDLVEARNRKSGNVAVRSWGFVLSTLSNWRKEGGPPPLDVPPSAKPTAAAVESSGREEPRQREEEARQAREKERLLERWGLRSEAEREDIEADVRSKNPGLARFRPMFEAECLAEMDRRDQGEIPRAP